MSSECDSVSLGRVSAKVRFLVSSTNFSDCSVFTGCRCIAALILGTMFVSIVMYFPFFSFIFTFVDFVLIRLDFSLPNVTKCISCSLSTFRCRRSAKRCVIYVLVGTRVQYQTHFFTFVTIVSFYFLLTRFALARFRCRIADSPLQ